MKLSVILRTHSGANVHPGTRVVAVPKEELILRCLNSLLVSIAQVPTTHTVTLTIVDDHSATSTLEGMQKLCEKHGIPAELKQVSDPGGNGASMKTVYETARDDVTPEAYYFVEDDYLHLPSAVSEMIEAYLEFKQHLAGSDVAIFPIDYPDNYAGHMMKPSYVVHTAHRHWRTIGESTGTCMVSRATLLKYWDAFMALTHYGEPGVTEETTINKIWRDGVVLFAPLPTLTFHMQFRENMPVVGEWKTLWETNALSPSV